MKRAALYVRVSTQEQKKHGLSVDSQIVALQKYCEDNDMYVVEVYNDAGISARKPYSKRPALLQLLQDCESGKIDIILFTRLDRWFRSVAGYHEVQSRLDACNVPWRSIWEDYNTETSDGIFKVNIMLSIAQAEADRTSEKIKSVNEYRRSVGGYVGSAPLGYKICKSDLVIDEQTEEAVKAFFKTFGDTFNAKKAVDSAGRYGVVISRERARNMLKNKTYCGDAYGYSCEKYITVEEYERNSTILSERRCEMSGRRRTYLFNGLLRCKECGKPLFSTYTLSNIKGKQYSYHIYKCSGAYDYYVCNSKKYIFERKLESSLINDLESMIEDCKVSRMKEVQSFSDYENEKKKLEARLKRIGVRYEDGDISIDEYRQKRDVIKDSIAKLQKPSFADLPELPSNWKDMYNELTMDSRKEFWHKILRCIYIKKDGSKYDYSVEFL